jgi:cardiolipin synthase A/B
MLRPALLASLLAFVLACRGTGGTHGSNDGGDPLDDGGTATDSGGFPTTANVQIIVEPSDNGAALLQAITGARTSVHMTMYLLTSSDIIDALVAQKQAGREVKVVLNKTFPASAGSNQSAYSTLQGAGVQVRWAPTGFTYTHAKCVIIDGTIAWIMTMNATNTSASSNREFLAVDRDAEDVAEAEAIFRADFDGTAASARGKLLVAPDNARDKLVTLIGMAQSTIDMEAEAMGDYMIVNSLAEAADRGVQVRMVLSDETLSSSEQQDVDVLKQHGVSLVQVSTPYIHSKSLVVDGTLAYVGSANFTTNSLTSNRELGVMVSAAAEVAKVLSTTSADFARGTPQ